MIDLEITKKYLNYDNVFCQSLIGKTIHYQETDWLVKDMSYHYFLLIRTDGYVKMEPCMFVEKEIKKV